MSSATTEKAPTAFESEVVTRSIVQDVTLPGGAGTLALVTLDNGFDHTKPNTFGPATLVNCRPSSTACTHEPRLARSRQSGSPASPSSSPSGQTSRESPRLAARAGGRDRPAGHRAFASIMDLPVPTFGFVNGAAMGGGVEIALACDYRTISGGVPAVALPECFLGLVPGWGGCYLLPRLLGAPKALKVIIENPLSMNRMLQGRRGLTSLGSPMRSSAGRLPRGFPALGRRRRERPGHDHPPGPHAGRGRVGRRLRCGRQARGRQDCAPLPAPYRAIDLVRAARTSSRDDAFAAEDAALGDLLMGDELRAVSMPSTSCSGVPSARPVRRTGPWRAR